MWDVGCEGEGGEGEGGEGEGRMGCDTGNA
jgi:hypothetical protein